MVNKCKKLKKFVMLIVIFIVAVLTFSNTSKAAKTGFLEEGFAPRKYFSMEKNKFSDITLTIVGSTKIQPDEVKFYEVDKNGNNPKEIDFSSSITTNRKNHIYTLSHEKLLKGKEHYFYITIKDMRGNINESYFKVFIKNETQNNQEISYYSIDDSPRTTQWVSNEGILHFIIKDIEGIKDLKIQDVNNNNKEIKYQNLDKGESVISINTNSLKSLNGVFNLKLIASENDSNYAQKSTQIVSFKLSHEKVEISPEIIKLNKTEIKLDLNSKNTEKLEVQIEPKIVTVNQNIKWISSNTNVVTVDTNGNVQAKKTGTATITAKTGNGKTAQCKVTVIDNVVKKLDGKNVTLPTGDKVYFLDTQFKDSSRVIGSDAFIIESNGKYAMIDTALSSRSSRIEKYLKELNIKELEFVLITHCHSDHVGGYKTVDKQVKIKKLYIKKRTNKTLYNKVIEVAKNSGTEICHVNEVKNQQITLGNFKFKLYNTVDRVQNQDINENVNSIVALATVNNRTIYFAGDIQNATEIKAENITANQVNKDLKAMGKNSIDVYKVAHHSYNTNNSEEALKSLNPKNAVVTNKKDRSGTTEAAKRINKYITAAKGKMYYTESGTVVLNVTEKGIISFTKLPNYYD